MNTHKHTETAEQDVRMRIVGAAAELFPQYGVKAVSMDEIARNVGISKRTLYEYFADKEDLLVACLEYNSAQMKLWGDSISEKAPTVLHVVMEIYAELMPKFRNNTERFHQDLMRYPKAVAVIKALRKEHVRESRAFFTEGVQQGLFVPAVNYDILSRMMMRMLDMPIPTEVLEHNSVAQVRATVMLTLLRGTCTEKGRQILDDYLTEYRSQTNIF